MTFSNWSSSPPSLQPRTCCIHICDQTCPAICFGEIHDAYCDEEPDDPTLLSEQHAQYERDTA